MLPTPRRFCLVAGSAEGATRLNAFDNALLAAGIGNLNLLKVSSILPPEAEQVDSLDIPAGSLVPTAYACVTSEVPGEEIAAAVAVGLSEGGYGVIMEFSGKTSQEDAEAAVKRMVKEAFRVRGLALQRVLVKSTRHVVERTGCAFAAVALWY